MPLDKIFRIGHRTPKNGVITIASSIVNDTISYGVSYCSPKEKQYDKQLGINMSRNNLRFSNKFIPLPELKHAVVINAIINDILTNTVYPDWAENLLLEQSVYPSGLVRYSSPKLYPSIDIMNIKVDSEFTKQQLLLASKYLHDAIRLDNDFMAINVLTHLYTNPDLIEVDDGI